MKAMTEDKDEKRRKEAARADQRSAMGDRLKALRESRGLGQIDVADAAGIKQPSLVAIEKGQTKEITASTLIGLCQALETTVEYAWTGGTADQALEAELLAIFRALDPGARKGLVMGLRANQSRYSPPTVSAPAPSAAVPKDMQATARQRRKDALSQPNDQKKQRRNS